MALLPYTLEQAEEDVADLRGQVDALDEYAEIGTLVVLVAETAIVPGTSTSPATQETWHSFAPLSSSWTVPGSGFSSYRITPMNELQISAWIKAPNGSQNNVTIATFPVGYRPLSTHGFPIGADIANNSAGNSSCLMTITSGGVMQSGGVGALSNVYIEAKIPLDR